MEAPDRWPERTRPAAARYSERPVYAAHRCHPFGGRESESLKSSSSRGARVAMTWVQIRLACQRDERRRSGGEPRPVAGCNMLATLSLEQTVEVLRKHEGGT